MPCSTTTRSVSACAHSAPPPVTLETVARNAGVSVTSWRNWEAGRKAPRLVRGQAIASALGVPMAALFRSNVVAEVVVSDETVQRIRSEGRGACADVAKRLAAQLEPAIYEAATRKPADLRAGVRAKPRRSRAQVLAGVRQATEMRAAKERRALTIDGL
jgi:transcriptional regulator with XRE-family HTH domain